jgi:hypothetical protein
MRPIAIGLLVAVVGMRVQPAADPAAVLSGMRQALGGDAAIAAVQAFSVSGSESRELNGHPLTADIEWLCRLPDRFVKVRRVATSGGQDVRTNGFNADALIYRHQSDARYQPELFEHETPDERVEREKQSVRNLKHEFSRFAIAMIGIAAVDPLDASAEAQQKSDSKVLDVVALRSSDGYEARLYVDAASHLPFAIAWLGPPIVVFNTTTTQIARVPRGQSPQAMLPPPPPNVPAGDPTAGLPKVLHQLRFEDFRHENGLNWPHRIVEMIGAQTFMVTKLGKFKINPAIDPKKFAVK